MPYNTTAIPPRKEVTGQTQLPLSRVKKIIAQDPDISICSNNAAFVITIATELFVQHLAKECLTQAKLERKPRRNIQYKDVASAVQSVENLEFLGDLVPKTVKYKDIKATAAAKRAQLRTGPVPEANEEAQPVSNGGKKHKASISRSSLNGSANIGSLLGGNGARRQSEEDGMEDPNDQIEMEMRQARGQDDVDMTG
ncbi:histone-fold-containing protein [Pseudomassariella vexata]|uniref:Histone-fold-containing protein n=1 Tax=Pseudomassariella vexata TaxID=1141098 RepID=A0A1Y2E0G0_9PEZI|nr:histone-fold-containing protein [Pseudomassariella vexata]ORY64959.1 histone-fold-containing protein [Pseudomassariella vexata]